MNHTHQLRIAVHTTIRAAWSFFCAVRENTRKIHYTGCLTTTNVDMHTPPALGRVLRRGSSALNVEQGKTEKSNLYFSYIRPTSLWLRMEASPMFAVMIQSRWPGADSALPEHLSSLDMQSVTAADHYTHKRTCSREEKSR